MSIVLGASNVVLMSEDVQIFYEIKNLTIKSLSSINVYRTLGSVPKVYHFTPLLVLRIRVRTP
jgi:hypothetical protein